MPYKGLNDLVVTAVAVWHYNFRQTKSSRIKKNHSKNHFKPKSDNPEILINQHLS
jgi:hypothetical protein